MLPLEFKPAHSVGDLLTQHLNELEQEAERKGGVLQVLSDHFGSVPSVTIAVWCCCISLTGLACHL